MWRLIQFCSKASTHTANISEAECLAWTVSFILETKFSPLSPNRFSSRQFSGKKNCLGRVTGIVLSGGYILFWLSWCFPKMKSQAWWKSQNPFTNLLGSLSRKYRGCHSKRIMAAQACWCKHNADWKCWQIYQSQQKIIYTKKLQVLHSEMRNEIMHLFISSFYSLSDLSALWRGTPLKCVSICAVKTLQLAQTANKLHRAAPYRWQYLQLGSQTADPLWAAC